MSYAATSSFNLVVRSGTVVYRSGAGYDFDGVHVDGFGDGLLRLTAEPGVAIATDGLLADGIQVHSQARNDIEIVSGANIVALNSDGFSNGILGWIDDQSQPNQLSTSTASITIEQLAGSTVEVRGEYGAGVYGLHHGLGSVHIDAAGEVRASGLGSYGVVGYILNPEATGDIQINLASTGQVVTDGEGVIGLFAPHLGLGGSAITVAGRVETNLLNSDGAQVSLTNEANLSAATIDILEGGAITARGPRSYAAWAYNQGQGLTRITHRGSAVASGTQSAGLRAEARGEARVIIAGSVAAPGEYGVGVQASSSEDAATVEIAAGTTVTGGWQADATSVGDESKTASAGVVLWSQDSALANAGAITAASDRAIADAGRWDTAHGALTVANSGAVTGFVELANVAGNRFTNAAGGVFEARHFADTNGDGVRDTKRVAISDFGGTGSRFDNLAGATVRLAQAQGAVAVDAAGYYAPGGLDAGFYSLARSGVAQAQFTNLAAFDHAGTIDLRGPEIGNSLVITGAGSAASGPGGGVFTANGGQLLINTVLNEGGAASRSDVLVVDGTARGGAPTTIVIDRREGSGARSTGNGILLVEVRDPAASAADVFTLQGDYTVNGEQRLAGGLYSYGLYRNGVGADAADGNWYLRTAGYTPTVPVYQEYPKVLAGLFRLPTLDQRTGTRHWPDTAAGAQNDAVVVEANGFWGRIEGVHGEYEAAASSAAAEYETTTWRLQAGLDRVLRENDSGKLIGGVSVHYGKLDGEITAVDGSGDVDSTGYGLGASLTWYGTNGLYVDAQGQATWLDSDLTSSSLGARLLDGHNGFGYALGLEAGRRLRLNAEWSLTPQAQLVYSKLDFDDFTDPLGAPVSLEDGDSLRGRLGLAAERAKTWQADDGTTSRTNFYGIANLYNEFSDGYRVSILGEELTTRNDRLWGGLGLGGAYNWKNDKYSLYGEATVTTSLKNFGDSHTVGGVLGLRIKW